jgi:hypothetical protein
MPVVSFFHGIKILMYTREHTPIHFHVSYAEYKAVILINDLSIDEGHLLPKIYKIVKRWAEAKKEEIIANWYSLTTKGNFLPISPLD